jgi:hypothetical protein
MANMEETYTKAFTAVKQTSGTTAHEALTHPYPAPEQPSNGAARNSNGASFTAIPGGPSMGIGESAAPQHPYNLENAAAASQTERSPNAKTKGKLIALTCALSLTCGLLGGAISSSIISFAGQSSSGGQGVMQQSSQGGPGSNSMGVGQDGSGMGGSADGAQGMGGSSADGQSAPSQGGSAASGSNASGSASSSATGSGSSSTGNAGSSSSSSTANNSSNLQGNNGSQNSSTTSGIASSSDSATI